MPYGAVMPRRIGGMWVHMPYEHPLFSSMDPERDRIAHMAILPRLSVLAWSEPVPATISYETLDFEGRLFVVRGRNGRPEHKWLWTRKIGDGRVHNY